MDHKSYASDVEGDLHGASSVANVVPVELGWRPLALIFVAALTLRGIVLFDLSQTAFFSSLLGDSMGYHVWAETLAGGDWIGDEVFYQAPLYPYLLGILYSFFGANALIAKLAQVVLEAFSCILLAGAGARFFGSVRVGILAGALASVYAPAIFFTTLVQKASLGFFFTSLVLNLLSRIYQSIRSPSLLLLLGTSLGLLALTRENALIFIPIIVAWLAVKVHRTPSRRLAGWIALLLLGASIPLVSVGLRNYVVGGEFTLTTSQFGTNFFIGNNANANGFYLPLRLYRGNVRYERDDAVEMAEAATRRKLSPAEVSEFWTATAIDYIRNNPVDWLGLMVRKAFLVLNGVEASDSEDIAVYRHFSWLLNALARFLNFGTLVPLAAAGIWLTRRRWREFAVLYAMMTAYAASLTIFFLFARYRVPLVPFALIFAAVGVKELRTLVVGGDRRAQMQTGLVIACAAVAANLPLTDTQKQMAATYKNFGGSMIEAERFPEAIEFFEKSLSYRSNITETLRGMAEALARLDRLPESRTYFERILEIEPDDPLARLGLAQVELLQGDIEEGLRELESVTEIDPSDHRAYYFLGMHYAHKGDLPSAVSWLRRASERESGTTVGRLELAKALYQNGDASAAEVEAEWIVQRDSSNDGAVLLLASILNENEQFERARSLYLELLERRPDDATARKQVERIDRTIQLRKRIAALEVVVQTRPDDLDSRVDLSMAYYRSGRWDDSQSELEEALRMEPLNARHYLGLAEIALKKGNVEEAENLLRKALAIDSSLAFAHIKLGLLLSRSQRLDEAAKAFVKAGSLEPGNPVPHFYRGQLAEMQDQKELARSHYARALEIDSKHHGSREALKRLNAL
jgi:tetratricopeptide (TPR) repeat protein